MIITCCICYVSDNDMRLAKIFICNSHYCCESCEFNLLQCPICDCDRKSYESLISLNFLKQYCVLMEINIPKSIKNFNQYITFINGIQSEHKTTKEWAILYMKWCISNPKTTHIPKRLRNLVWKLFGVDICQICDNVNMSYDNFECGHIISEHNGGGTTIDNLRPICRPCNSSMGRSNLIPWCQKYMPCASILTTISPIESTLLPIESTLLPMESTTLPMESTKLPMESTIPISKYTCKLCGYTFNTYNGHKNHVHKKICEKQKTQQLERTCSTCGHIYSSVRNLKDHLKKPCTRQVCLNKTEVRELIRDEISKLEIFKHKNI